MKIFQPLEQFEIYNVNLFLLRIYNTYIPFTIYISNFVIYLFIIIIFITFFFKYSINNNFVIPRIWNFIVESLFIFISQLFVQNLTKSAQRFLPFFFYLFLFILVTNLVGFLPYSFTITSSIVVTFSLAFSYWLGLMFLSIWKFKLNFFLFFIPGNIPTALKPILTVLEILSYISRPFSLSIRLFANMLSGHTLLYILSNICLKLFKFSIVFMLFPLILIILLNFLEAGISFLQAYVFYTLMIIYFKEAYYLAH
jgi:F-type H+-transporting ATPase subunit a